MSDLDNQSNEEDLSKKDDLIEDEKIIFFRKPIEVGGVSYDRIELREPTAGEMSKATKNATNVEAVINLIVQIGKVPRSVVEKIGLRDFQAADQYLKSFLDVGLEIGEM